VCIPKRRAYWSYAASFTLSLCVHKNKIVCPCQFCLKFKQVRNETRKQGYIAKEMMSRTQHSADDVSHWTHYCRGKEARSSLQTTKIQQKKLKVRDVYHNIKCQSVYFKLKARNGEKEQINCNMAFEGVPSSYLPI